MTQITVKVVGADIVRPGLQDLEAQIPKIGRKGIYDMMVRVRSRLAQKPRRPSYPINWDSEKQRRYVLALLRRKDNLPYKPTGRYEANWKILKREPPISVRFSQKISQRKKLLRKLLNKI